MMWLLILLALWWALWGILRWRRPAWPWLADGAAWGGLGVAVVLFHWRLVVGDAYMPADGGDMASFLYPNFVFNARALRSLSIPLWNPHVYGGYPYAGEVQSGFYYPVNWPFFLWGHISYRTLEALSILHTWWAAAGAYTLARALPLPSGRRVGRVAALLAGVAFGFSDVFLVHFGNENLLAAIAWLPWVLWGATVVTPTGAGTRPRARVLVALFLGLSVLAGHPQMSLYVVLALGLYLLLWGLLAAEGARHWRYWIQVARTWVPPVAVGMAIGAVVLVPGWDVARFSERATWSYGQAVGFSLAPGQLVGLLVPGFLGRGAQLYWGVWPRVEIGYVGVMTLFLAALGVLRYWTRTTQVWLALSVVAFLFSMGVYTPVHGWLTAIFPPLKAVRAPARFVVVMDLGLALLAAVGLEVLQEHVPQSRAALRTVYRWLRGALLVTGALVWPLLMLVLLIGQGQDRVLVVRQAIAANAVGLFLLFLAAGWLVWRARMDARIPPRTAAWLMVGIVLVDLAATGAYTDIGGADPTRTFRHENIAAFLRQDPNPFRVDSRTGIDQLWQPDTAVVLGLEDVHGVANPLVPAHTLRFLRAAGDRASPLYPLLNTKYLIAGKEPPFDVGAFPPVFTEDPELNVYLNPQALPRAFLVRDVTLVRDAETAWEHILREDFDPRTQAVVVGPWDEPPSSPRSTDEGGAESLAFAGRTPQSLKLAVQVRRPALLVLSEFWFPGWRAEVRRADGSTVSRPVLRVNYALRGVQVFPGDVEVRLWFLPRSWVVGAAVSLLALAGWALWVWRVRGQT